MKVYKSIIVQLFYNLSAGIGLLTMPNTLIPLFGFKPTDEPWIYAMGLFVITLCFTYYQIIRVGNERAVMGTVYGRWFFTSVVTVSAICGLVPLTVIPAMLCEAGFACWTLWEVRQVLQEAPAAETVRQV
ncbi:MAG: hypothetical protein V4543_01925 [Bacteroidota bacterium]